MRGTEKQIAWASEIQERVCNILSDGIEMQKQIASSNTSNLAGFIAILDVVENFDGYAGDMISMFKDIIRSGDTRKDLASVLMTIRASRISPANSGDFGTALRDVLFTEH